MFDTFLSPQGIALITSLAAPVGAWVIQSSMVLAESFAESETKDFIKRFFRKRVAEKHLSDTFKQAIQATLDDGSVVLDPQMRKELSKTRETFNNFSRFVDTYHQLSNLPFTEQRATARGILREYIQKRAPSVTNAVLDTIEMHFSEGAFTIIENSIKKSPEVFCEQALKSLDRIEEALRESASGQVDIKKNLEIIRASAEYYQRFAPDIPDFKKHLSDIEIQLNEVQQALKEQGPVIERIDREVEDIKNIVRTSLGKSLDHARLINELADLEEDLSALLESQTKLRQKYSEKIEDKKKEIALFEQDVLRLAESIRDRKIDGERLRQVQKAFEDGDFSRTRELLNADDLKADQDYLLAQKEDNSRKLLENATEYLIKAQATLLDLASPTRFSEAEEYYVASIRSSLFFDNLFRYGYFLQKHRRYTDAEGVYFRILTQLKEEIQSDEVASTLNDLAILHQITNRYEAAEKEYIEALQIYRELASANPVVYRPGVARTLNNLAVLHRNTNKYEAAEKENIEALAIYQELESANPVVYRPDVARTLNNLAVLHIETNEYEAAEKEYIEALQIYRELASTNPVVYQEYVATTLHNLSDLHMDTNDYKAAEKEATEALLIRRDLASVNPMVHRPDVAKTLNNLVVLHTGTKEYETAEKDATEALGIYRELASVNPMVYRPDVARTLYNLANLHIETNEYEAAEKEYTEALQICREFASVNPAVYLPYVATTLNNLAFLYTGTKEYEAAEKKSTEALAIYQELESANPGIYQRYVAETLNYLACLHTGTKEYGAAEMEYTEALQICRELALVIPMVHRPGVAWTLHELALLHTGTKEYEAAEKEYAEALQIRQELASVNPMVYRLDVARTLTGLANLHMETNEYEAAEKEFTEALHICREFASVNPAVYRSYVAMTLHNLALLHTATKEYGAAEKEYTEALAIRRELALVNPAIYQPDMAKTEKNLTSLREKMIE